MLGPSATKKPVSSARRAKSQQCLVDVCQAGAVARGLRGYLKHRFGLSRLGYAAVPTPIQDGWETYLYTLHLKGSRLPPSWKRPLTLRIHASRHGVARAKYEFKVSRWLTKQQFPVPRPLLLEESCSLFGGPFLILEHLPGTTPLHRTLWEPWHLFSFPEQMAEMHARLHQLPAQGFPAPRGSFLNRQLRKMRDLAHKFAMSELLPGIDWLQKHRPKSTTPDSILHLDFHPLNLIDGGDGELSVLDWTYADVGDFHADVATTLTLLESVVPAAPNLWGDLLLRIGRSLVTRDYLQCYRRRQPVDDARLAYYRAWSALNRVIHYGRWLRTGPEAFDCKPMHPMIDVPRMIRALRRYFQHFTGVKLAF